MFNDKDILITGGTGSFGKETIKQILENYKPKRIMVFSRDELKQFEMREQFPDGDDSVIRYFIGDVRDYQRLYRAFDGVDYVIHAAALKQVPAAEYNPTEAIKTNIDGAINVINAAIDRGVKKVIALSTDKAVNPINLYGATKLCSDKLFIDANNLSAGNETRFGVVRYGNVFGSRGSVVPFFLKQKEVIPITDLSMTRFIITLPHGAKFTLQSLGNMVGGEIFVPKIPSAWITDLADAIAPGVEQRVVGIRPGEKLHEVLISEEDYRNTVEFKNQFVILSDSTSPSLKKPYLESNFWKPGPSYSYASNTNIDWVGRDQLSMFLQDYKEGKLG